MPTANRNINTLFPTKKEGNAAFSRGESEHLTITFYRHLVVIFGKNRRMFLSLISSLTLVLSLAHTRAPTRAHTHAHTFLFFYEWTYSLA